MGCVGVVEGDWRSGVGGAHTHAYTEGEVEEKAMGGMCGQDVVMGRMCGHWTGSRLFGGKE